MTYLNFAIFSEKMNKKFGLILFKKNSQHQLDLCKTNFDTEPVSRRCSVKKVFLELSQNSQENTCASLFFNKVAGLQLY